MRDHADVLRIAQTKAHAAQSRQIIRCEGSDDEEHRSLVPVDPVRGGTAIGDPEITAVVVARGGVLDVQRSMKKERSPGVRASPREGRDRGTHDQYEERERENRRTKQPWRAGGTNRGDSVARRHG